MNSKIVRLIDANMTKEAIELLCKDERTNMTAITYFALLDLLDTMPTIEAERVNGWISVKDRLPEKDGEYLVHGVVHMLQQEHLITRVSSYCSNNSHFGEQDYFTTITHWTYLPESPKREDDAE